MGKNSKNTNMTRFPPSTFCDGIIQQCRGKVEIGCTTTDLPLSNNCFWVQMVYRPFLSKAWRTNIKYRTFFFQAPYKVLAPP